MRRTERSSSLPRLSLLSAAIGGAFLAAPALACPVGTWNVRGHGAATGFVAALEFRVSITSADTDQVLALPALAWSRSDEGSAVRFGPGDIGFDGFAAALTNGVDDTIAIEVRTPNGADTVAARESEAFGGAGGPDFAGTDIGSIRIDLDTLTLDAVQGDGPTFFGYEITLEPHTACPSDVDDDDTVGLSDLLAVISAWGAPACGTCTTDVDCDGVTGLADVLQVLESWGACP
jgi:hypothetical protein